MDFDSLAASPDAELERILRASRGPAPEALGGYEWRGWNTPWCTRLLGVRKFIKGFFKSGSGVEGYNIPARQNAIGEPWLHRPRPEDPRRFGFYRVLPAGPASGGPYPGAVLLDYGASPRNAWYRIERLLRDYLVQPDPSNADLLLGKAYAALGPARVACGFFVLARLRPTSWTPRD